MKKLTLNLSEAAASDILEQADWYELQSGAGLSRRWERAVSSALLRLMRRPRTGAKCLFKSDQAQGLRRLVVEGFPKHLIFYRLEKDEVLILRVIHGARDLDSLF